MDDHYRQLDRAGPLRHGREVDRRERQRADDQRQRRAQAAATRHRRRTGAAEPALIPDREPVDADARRAAALLRAVSAAALAQAQRRYGQTRSAEQAEHLLLFAMDKASHALQTAMASTPYT